MTRFLLAATAAFVAWPAAAQTFTGPRIEANVGYDAVHADDAPAAIDGTDGVRLGLAIGYDVAVAGRVIVGVEAGAGFNLADSSRTTIVGTPATERYRVDNGRDLEASARVGYLVSPSTMLFAKAGWANSAATVRLERTAGATTTRTKITDDDHGLRVGGGLEHMLASRAYVKAEYRYTSYGHDVDRHQALVGFGLRF